MKQLKKLKLIYESKLICAKNTWASCCKDLTDLCENKFNVVINILFKLIFLRIELLFFLQKLLSKFYICFWIKCDYNSDIISTDLCCRRKKNYCRYNDLAYVTLNTFCRNTKVWFYYGNPVVDGKQRKSREKERKYTIMNV